MSITRREFVQGAAAATAAGLTGATMAANQNEEQAKRASGGPGGPAIIASANGVEACKKAMEMIKAGGDPLDAVVAGVNIVEDDPNDHSVGLGGLPNEEGVVQLDACVMDGPTHKAGGVGALENVRNAASVAKLVMRRTDHVLIVGEGALKFAKAHGFKEENLLTDKSREIWLKWKETHSDKDDWLHPEADVEARRRLLHEKGEEFTYGTINCCALTAEGNLAGVTTTSGLSYKIPGRVGDSPIIGAGLYVDNEVGAAGSTGRGEANLQNLSSFMAVEYMRNGMTPEEACLAVLKRVAHKTEPRLLDKNGEPVYALKLYAIRKDGMVGGASLRGAGTMAYHDGNECRLIPIPHIYED